MYMNDAFYINCKIKYPKYIYLAAYKQHTSLLHACMLHALLNYGPPTCTLLTSCSYLFPQTTLGEQESKQ